MKVGFLGFSFGIFGKVFGFFDFLGFHFEVIKLVRIFVLILGEGVQFRSSMKTGM